MNVPTLVSLMERSAAEYGVTVRDMLSDRRDTRTVRARDAFCWRARHETLHSLPAIGRAIRKDGTTVLHAVRRHEARRQEGPT